MRWGGLVALVSFFGFGCAGADPNGSGANVDSAGSGGNGAQAGTGGATISTGGGFSRAGASSGTGGAPASGGSSNAVPYPNPDWPSSSPEANGIDPAGIAQAQTIAEGYCSYCLLVIRHGALVSEKYWNGSDATTPQRSWSIAKSYASALVGIAIARGDISSLDDSVANYVTEWKGSPREAIKIRDILSMTSGLKWDVFSDYVTMVTLSPNQTTYALGIPADKQPGSEWVYDNAAIQVLDPVFHAATGHSIEEYAELYLWSWLGMKASWAHDSAGNPTVYASVLASCRDHARLGYLYLHGGVWGTHQVVPAEHVKSTLTPSQSLNRAYGYLWWLNSETPALDAMMEPWPGRMAPFAPTDHFAARGFGNQFIDVYPSLDMIVVRFGPDPLTTFNLAELTTDQKFEKHDAIVKPILDAVTD